MSKMVFIDCPNCGMPSEFGEQFWNDCCTPEHILDRRKKRPDVPDRIHCRTCNLRPTRREW